jgi:arsenate reductase
LKQTFFVQKPNESCLQPYVKEFADEAESVPADRKEVLDAIAGDVAARLRSGKQADLTFICNHNSRRSHMSQIWAATAAYYYGLNGVHTFSGGTEATACNCRTVAAMRRVGFDIEDATTGDNPIYLVRYAADRPAVRVLEAVHRGRQSKKRLYCSDDLQRGRQNLPRCSGSCLPLCNPLCGPTAMR